MTRRRRSELVVLAFGVAFAAAVLFSLRARLGSGRLATHRAVPGVPPRSEAGQPTTVLSQFDYTETVRGKPVFRIRSERTVGFGPAAGLAPERYALEKVHLTLYPEEGAPVTVEAEKADYDAKTKAAVLRGNVRWTDDKGGMGETETVEYRPDSRVLVARDPVHFAQGSFEATARSGTYDVGHRETQLAGPVKGTGTGQDSGGLASLAADSASYRRADLMIDLSGNVSAEGQGGDRLASDRLLLQLDSEGKHLDWARALGHVKGRLVSSSAAAGPTPAPGTTPQPRDYAGNQGVLFYGPDGRPRSLSLTGQPASVAEGNRRVTAEAIDVALVDGKPVTANAQRRVELTAPPNEASADSAVVRYGPGGEIVAVELSGSVRMKGDGKAATAERAVQVPDRDVWLLTGSASASAAVQSGGSKLSAPRIEIGQKNRTVTADGGARAVFEPEKGKPVATYPVGDPSKPTYGKAARIALDDNSKIATLSGGASLWQESSSVSADDITLNDADRTLAAVGNARAVLPPSSSAQAAQDKRSSSGEPPPTKAAPAKDSAAATKAESTVVTSQSLHYKDAASQVTFEKDVVMTRGLFRASAADGAAWFDAEHKVERVELTGSVSLDDATAGRKGQADRAVDSPKLDRTILEGNPAVVTDAEGNRVAGATLTITERGRRVEVTAPEGGKTVTVHKTRPN
jgi:LPS export ABC transporter protein LptC